MLKVVQDESQPNEHAPAAVGGTLLDELVRDRLREGDAGRVMVGPSGADEPSRLPGRP